MKIWQRESNKDIMAAIREIAEVEHITNEVRLKNYGPVCAKLWKEMNPTRKERYIDRAEKRNNATATPQEKAKYV